MTLYYPDPWSRAKESDAICLNSLLTDLHVYLLVSSQPDFFVGSAWVSSPDTSSLTLAAVGGAILGCYSNLRRWKNKNA